MSRRLAVPAFLAAVVLIVFAGPLFLGKTFLLRDHISYVTPSRWHLAQSLRGGVFPEWWNALGLGTPYAANPNHSALYPPVWLVAVLPVRFATDVIVILHMLATALGGAALARRLGADDRGAALAGTALLCCGYVGEMPPLCLAPLSLAWIPWVAWGADRVATATGWARIRAALVLAALWSGQVFSGDPASLVDGGWLAGLVLLARAPGWRARGAAVAAALGAAALAVAMSAALVLPALDLMRRSDRASGLSVADAAVWPMRPFRLLELVWPRPFGDPNEPLRDFSTNIAGVGFGEQTERWAGSEHLGAVVLLLAAVAAVKRVRGAWAIWAGVIVMLVLAVGLHTPLYKLYLKIPFARYLRYPEKHMVVVAVAVTALAGVGLTRLASGGERARYRAAIAATVLGVILTGGAILATAAREPVIHWLTARAKDGFQTMQLYPAYGTALLGGYLAAGGALAAAAALLASDAVRTRARSFAIDGLAAAALIPCVIHGATLQYLGDRSVVRQRPALLAGEPDAADPLAPPRVYREERTTAHGWTNRETVYASHDTLVPNMGWPFGYASVPGYDPALDPRLNRVFDAAEGKNALSRLVERYDVAYEVLKPDTAKAASLAPAATSPDELEVLVRNPPETRRPRAFVAPRWEVGDDTVVQQAILDATRDVGTVHIAGGVPPTIEEIAQGTEVPLTPCTLAGPRAEDVSETCDSPAGGWAVIADSWAPGWTATLDGAPAAVERADLILRAVRVGPGKHVVRWRYQAPGLRRGLAISGATWLVWLLLLLVTRRRRASAPAAPGPAPAPPPEDQS